MMIQKRRAIHYPELSKCLKPLFDEARTVAPEDLSELKKRIRVQDYFGVTDEAVRQFFKPEFERLNSYDDFHLAAMLEIIGIFWIFIGDTMFLQLRASTLEFIQHENGRVREAMRRVGEYMRIAPEIGKRGSKVTAEEYRDFLLELAALARALRRDANQSYNNHTLRQIRHLSPSPHKSACLLWARVVVKDIHTNWLSDAEIEALGMPIPERWISREESEEEIIEHEPWDTVRNTLSRRGRKEALSACASHLERLNAHARSLLESAMCALGYTPRDMESVYEKITREGTVGGGEDALTRVYLQQSARNNNFFPDDMNEFVRALQAVTNHAVFLNSGGNQYSHLLVAAIQQRDAYRQKKPWLFSELLQHLSNTHDAVHALCAEYIAFSEREFAHIKEVIPDNANERELRAVSSAIEIKKEFLARARTEAHHMESILHHAADWYAQIEPWAYVRERPAQLAAKLFWIVREYNASREISICRMIADKNLSHFAERKSASAIQDRTLYDVIIYSVRDPDLLLYPYGRWGTKTASTRK